MTTVTIAAEHVQAARRDLYLELAVAGDALAILAPRLADREHDREDFEEAAVAAGRARQLFGALDALGWDPDIPPRAVRLRARREFLAGWAHGARAHGRALLDGSAGEPTDPDASAREARELVALADALDSQRI
jgi:hypothetical protein